ncbi:MAG: hypothetical protein GX565_09210 [Lentisphaerae bacterium]|nr:hypothetical protein [Lentisphaerota bacterium]
MKNSKEQFATHTDLPDVFHISGKSKKTRQPAASVALAAGWRVLKKTYKPLKSVRP